MLATHLILTAQLYEAGSDLVTVTMTPEEGSGTFKQRADELNHYIMWSCILQVFDAACMLGVVAGLINLIFVDIPFWTLHFNRWPQNGDGARAQNGIGWPGVALTNGLFHFFGSVFTLFVLVDGWHWKSLIYIFWLFTVPPVVMEGTVMLAPKLQRFICFLTLEKVLCCPYFACMYCWDSCCVCLGKTAQNTKDAMNGTNKPPNANAPSSSPRTRQPQQNEEEQQQLVGGDSGGGGSGSGGGGDDAGSDTDIENG